MTAKTRTLLWLVPTTLGGGVLQQLFDEREGGSLTWTLLTMVAPLFLLFRWYVLDAAEREFRRSRALDIAIVTLGLFAMPYYLFRSRGGIGGLRSTAVFLLAATALWSADYAARYAVYLVQVSGSAG